MKIISNTSASPSGAPGQATTAKSARVTTTSMIVFLVLALSVLVTIIFIVF